MSRFFFVYQKKYIDYKLVQLMSDGQLFRNSGQKFLEFFFSHKTRLNSGIIVFTSNFLRTGLLLLVQRFLGKCKCNSLDLYNSAEHSLTLLASMEEAADINTNNNSWYGILSLLYSRVSSLFCKFSIFYWTCIQTERR